MRYAIIIGILAALGACSYPEIKLSEPLVNKLSLSKKYRVNLPEDHGTGYTWYLKDDYDKKLIGNINTVWHGNKKGVDFNFKTLAKGKTILTFVSRKYTDTADIKHYFVEIED